MTGVLRSRHGATDLQERCVDVTITASERAPTGVPNMHPNDAVVSGPHGQQQVRIDTPAPTPTRHGVHRDRPTTCRWGCRSGSGWAGLPPSESTIRRTVQAADVQALDGAISVWRGCEPATAIQAVVLAVRMIAKRRSKDVGKEPWNRVSHPGDGLLRRVSIKGREGVAVRSLSRYIADMCGCPSCRRSPGRRSWIQRMLMSWYMCWVGAGGVKSRNSDKARPGPFVMERVTGIEPASRAWESHYCAR